MKNEYRLVTCLEAHGIFSSRDKGIAAAASGCFGLQALAREVSACLDSYIILLKLIASFALRLKVFDSFWFIRFATECSKIESTKMEKLAHFNDSFEGTYQLLLQRR